MLTGYFHWRTGAVCFNKHKLVLGKTFWHECRWYADLGVTGALLLTFETIGLLFWFWTGTFHSCFCTLQVVKLPVFSMWCRKVKVTWGNVVYRESILAPHMCQTEIGHLQTTLKTCQNQMWPFDRMWYCSCKCKQTFVHGCKHICEGYSPCIFSVWTCALAQSQFACLLVFVWNVFSQTFPAKKETGWQPWTLP